MKFFKALAICLMALHPSIQASESYIALEANTGRVLLAYNTEKKRPVAGLTKIVTARVALDWANLSGTSLSSYVTVPASASQLMGINPMQLTPGDRIQFRDALYAAILSSDSIAAHTLCIHVGQELLRRRQIAGDPEKAFVAEMNLLAKSLGMRRTRFTNAHGLDAYSRRAQSTASDIARISVHVMRDVGFGFYVKQPSRQVTILNASGEKRSYTLKNNNPLIGEMGINGIKAGMSAEAGQCISINAHRSPVVRKIDDTRSQIRKRDLIVVVLGSHDRQARVKQLIAEAWPIYDQWAEQGFVVSPKRRELLHVPRLQ
ncbi:MAG: D-alanyl-D-alanine carboxypeptidase family protein [Akkermansiaceae bacterium]